MILNLVAIAVALLIAIPFPLSGTPGPEAAMLLGAIVGPALFIDAARRQSKDNPNSFAADFSRLFFWLTIATAVFISATSLNALRITSCASDRGLLPFFVLSFPVLLLNIAGGMWLGRLINRRPLATIAAIFFLLAYLGFQVFLWWQAPSLRFINHLFFAITSDLANGQGLSQSLIFFRIATLLFALTLLLGGLMKPNRNLAGLMMIMLFSAIGLHWLSLKDLMPSRAKMAKRYSFSLERGPLVIHADPLINNVKHLDALLAEGNLWLDRLDQRLGSKPLAPIHIWLFPDVATLAQYTGAENVHFALPRHREIYISSVEVPHPTLGHELAHILIGQETDNLFGTPGTIPFFPNVALTEGLAVALTPELSLNASLTMHEQSAAMFQAGIQPDLDKLFSPWPWHFWAESSQRAYTVAGSLLNNLVEIKSLGNPERAAALYRQIAKEGTVLGLFSNKKEQAAWFDAYQSQLLKTELPKDAVLSAARLFESNSALLATCDPVEEKRNQSALAALGAGDFDKARSIFSEPSPEHLLVMVKQALLFNNLPLARSLLQEAANNPKIKDARQRAEINEQLGDLLWATSDHTHASETWKSLDPSVLPPDRSRQLAVKISLADLSLTPALEILLNDTAKSTNWSRFLNLAHQKLDTPLPAYILARAFFNLEDFNHAVEFLLPFQEEIPELNPAVKKEALRLLAISQARIGKREQAVQIFTNIQQLLTRASERLQIQDMLERAQRLKEGDNSLLGYEH